MLGWRPLAREPHLPRFPLALLLLALAAPTAAAQVPAEPASAAFSRFLASPGHRNAIFAVAQQTNDSLPGGCGTIELGAPGPASVFRPPRFDGAGRPVDGIWAEPVTAKGCGLTRRLNVLTVVSPGRPPQSSALLPGTTRADPLQQRDALGHALGAGATLAKDCKHLVVTDTSFDDYEGAPIPDARDGRHARAWRETWTLWACGKSFDLAVDFVPDATGTKISVDPREAKPRG